LEETALSIPDTVDTANYVKSVLKAFSILEELDSAGELSIGELSSRLSMDKATVHRLVNTLKYAGYVNQNKDTKRYSNSFKLLAMGNRVTEKTGIKRIARPYLEELAKLTGETVNLGIKAGDRIVYIDKIESKSTIKVGLDIGTSIPMHCTGLGKAYLSFMPEEEVEELINNTIFERFTEHSIVDKDTLRTSLLEIRERGYSIDDEEYVIGLICFGAPIFDYHGNPIAAVSVSCPKYRVESKHQKIYADYILGTASKISRQMGYSL
jgi:DNA-binding IclR family transcriptional regulator